MSRIEKENITVGSGIIGIFQRMPQKLERVFAEFIDNSTQSFMDHKKELKEIAKKETCVVKITWDSREIVIEDNAYGMSRDDFRRALRINSPQDSYSPKSRGQYGMGLKIAAAYLGDWYSIETTMLNNSEKYYSSFDIQEMKKTNPDTVENIITETSLQEHYTKIVVKNMVVKFNSNVDKTLRKQLANIYNADLTEGSLEIYLNGIQILPSDPELRIDDETGSEYLKSFECEFTFNKYTYSFDGWIGILKTGSTDEAGFTLSQNGRGIILNYRPKEWKSNSFEYQRVVGVINLDDKYWKIAFNKDQFAWHDGLENEFVKALLDNKDVSELVSIAKSLRKKKTPVIDDSDVAGHIPGLQHGFGALNDPGKTQLEPTIPDSAPPVSLGDEKESNIIKVIWESIEYTFEVRVVSDDKNPDSDWIKICRKDGINEYYLVLNGLTNCFLKYNHKKCKSMMVEFAISLALAKLSSVRLGLNLDDSDIFINSLNQILRNIN